MLYSIITYLLIFHSYTYTHTNACIYIYFLVYLFILFIYLFFFNLFIYLFFIICYHLLRVLGRLRPWPGSVPHLPSLVLAYALHPITPINHAITTHQGGGSVARYEWCIWQFQQEFI